MALIDFHLSISVIMSEVVHHFVHAHNGFDWLAGTGDVAQNGTCELENRSESIKTNAQLLFIMAFERYRRMEIYNLDSANGNVPYSYRTSTLNVHAECCASMLYVWLVEFLSILLAAAIA